MNQNTLLPGYLAVQVYIKIVHFGNVELSCATMIEWYISEPLEQVERKGVGVGYPLISCHSL